MDDYPPNTAPDLMRVLADQRSRVGIAQRSESLDQAVRKRVADTLRELSRDARLTAECYRAVGMDDRAETALVERCGQLLGALDAGLFDWLDTDPPTLPPRTAHRGPDPIGTEL